MTRKQRIRAKIVFLKKNYAVGGARNAELTKLQNKYDTGLNGVGGLKQYAMHVGGCDYWN